MASGHGDEQRQSGRNDCAVDERQGAILVVNRVPFAAEKEFQAEGVPGETGLGYEFVNNQSDDGDHGKGARQHGEIERAVSHAAVASLNQGVGLCLSTDLQLLVPEGVAVLSVEALLELDLPCKGKLAESCYSSVKIGI